MGGSHSCGIGVINKSTIPEINIGVSITLTYYRENGVKENEIFYCWPGAVWCTVYAYPREPDGRNDTTSRIFAKERNLAAHFNAVATNATPATIERALTPAALEPVRTSGGTTGPTVETGATSYAGYKTLEAAAEGFKQAFESSKLYCERKGNYGGKNGSWLVVEGGPRMGEHGTFLARDLSIREATQDELFTSGNFTSESHGKFHTKIGLQCTRGCSHCQQ